MDFRFPFSPRLLPPCQKAPGPPMVFSGFGPNENGLQSELDCSKKERHHATTRLVDVMEMVLSKTCESARSR